MVALHSLRYAYNNISVCEAMPLNVAAKKTAGYVQACSQLDYDSAVGILHGSLAYVARRRSQRAYRRGRMDAVRERAAIRTIEEHLDHR